MSANAENKFILAPPLNPAGFEINRKCNAAILHKVILQICAEKVPAALYVAQTRSPKLILRDALKKPYLRTLSQLGLTPP